MDARAAMESMVINGGDDNEPEDPTPSHHEVLQASTVLIKHLLPIDKPYACQMETLTASMNHDLCLEEFQSLRDTTITSYFK